MLPFAHAHFTGAAVLGGVTLSHDTTLSLFEANDQTVTDGWTTNLVNGTTSTVMEVTCTHAGANVGTPGGTISGFTESSPGVFTWNQDSLATGDNPVAFTVTAQDGVTTHDYTLTLHVLTAGVAEETTLDFSSLAFGGADFVTAGEGRGFMITSPGGRHGYWGNTGTESVPSMPGVDFIHEVTLGAADSKTDVANAFHAAMVAFNLSSVSSDAFTATAEAVGPRTDAADVNSSGITITVTVQGTNPS